MDPPPSLTRSSSNSAKVPSGDRETPSRHHKMPRGYSVPLRLRPRRSVKTSLIRRGRVRSGFVDNSSTLWNPGNQANYWSRSSYSNANQARNLNFNDSNVNPSNNTWRYNGFSLRCLFRVLVPDLLYAKLR